METQEQVKEEVKEEVEDAQPGEQSEENQSEESPEDIAKKQESEKEKARNRLSDRNRTLTWKWKQEEEKRLALEERLKKIEESQKLKAEPDEDDYSDSEKFKADREKWQEQQRQEIESQAEQKVRQKIQQENYQKEIQTKQEIYLKHREKFAKDDDKFHDYEVDIDDAVNKYSAPEIQNLILDLKEKGPQFVKYLGTHPDELEKIASSSSINRAFLMGQIVPKLDAKTAKTVSSAPDPTRVVKGSAPKATATGRTFDRSKETFKEFAARQNKK